MSTFRRRPLEVAVALALAWLALPSHALKLGDPVVRSYVGQPLVAEYPIVDSTPEELRRLSISLAKPEAYSTIRANFHPALKTSQLTVVNLDGKHSVVVTTEGPVEDSVLDIVFELTWAAGRMVQSSTVLIDPPPSSIRVETPYFIPEEIPIISATTPYPSTPVRSSTVRSKALPTLGGIDTEVRVRKGDTLGAIAKRTLPGVPLEQALIALYNKNSQVIASKNVNLIQEGAILQIPTEAEAHAVDANQALKTLRIHASNFREYTARLAQQSAPSKPAEGGLTQSGSLRAPAVAVEESSKGDEVRVGAGKPKDATEIQNANAKKEAEVRQALLDKNLKALEELSKVRNAELAKLQAKVAKETAKEKSELTPPPDKNPNQVPVAPTSEAASSAPVAPGLVNPSTLLESEKPRVEEKAKPEVAQPPAPAPVVSSSSFKGAQPVVETPTLPETMKPSNSISDPSEAPLATTPVAPKIETPASVPAAAEAAKTKPKAKPKAAVVAPPPPPPPPESSLLDYWPHAAGGVGILALLGGWLYTRRKQKQNVEHDADVGKIVVLGGDSEDAHPTEDVSVYPEQDAVDSVLESPDLVSSEEAAFSTLSSLPSSTGLQQAIEEARAPVVEPEEVHEIQEAPALGLLELPPFDLVADDHALTHLTESLANELPELNVPLQGSDKDTYPVSVSYDPDEQLGIAKFYLGLQDFRGVWDMLTPLLSHDREGIRTQAHALLAEIPEEQRAIWEAERA